MLPACQTPYALTKYIGEQYCALFDSLYGLDTISLRYFQVCGPRQPTNGQYAVVTGIFLRQKVQGQRLTIHGDGSQKRDFVHVKDVALANIKAYESDAHNLVVNIGTGKSHSIKELADLISPYQMFIESKRKVDLIETRADTTLCQKLFNWSPKTSIYEIVQEMLRTQESEDK
jgi:UDP-glucose 4-epimerase